MADTANPDGYVLSRTASEYERLREQATIYGPFTDRVLAQAGLGAGMHVLDAGCGPGEVMRLMARRVGPAGSVTGVDIDPEVGAYGLQRLRAEEEGRFNFHSANLLDGAAVPGAPFDMVFCRFLLMHMTDPVAMVRRLAALTKPGGTLVAIESVLETLRCAPDAPALNRAVEILFGAISAAGGSLDAGVRLGEWFRGAGLPMPAGTDLQGFFRVTDGNSMLPKLLAGVAPLAIRLGLSTEEEIARLQAETEAISARREHCALWPTVTAAWTRVGG